MREHVEIELISQFLLPLQILQNRLQAFFVFVFLCMHVPADEVTHCMFWVLRLLMDGIVVTSGVLLQSQKLFVVLRWKLQPSFMIFLEGRIP